ncbi:uncharacterized protein LOC109791903 [Cajanus cajan]|uniref:uncharacterized protein LOC109791903 n=1 Tax=Cajanus cajan TaxID=3821 RepID=UPI00098DB8C0|nr:uncharacterized protein LOC109791903 [Cajanus cajan]
MAGRNDRAIADALQALAQAMNNNNRVGVAPNWLEQFQQNHPPTFKGGYDPDASMNWLTEIEKIFIVMDYIRRLIDGGVHLNWDNFKKVFLEKYFPDDVRSRKEMEFLELNQGNDTAADIYDRDNCARAAFYKGVGGPICVVISSTMGRNKPYSAPSRFQGSKVAASGSKSFTRGSIVSATRSVGGSMSTPSRRCRKCGRVGHNQSECRDKEVTCFNCSGKGHISTQCPEPPRTRVIGSGSQIERPKTVGRVFALSGAEATWSENLIQDFDLVVETHTNGPVTTSLVCLKVL